MCCWDFCSLSKYNNITSLLIFSSLVLLINTVSWISLFGENTGSVINKLSILIFGILILLLTDKNDVLLYIFIFF